jgi:hypothetical protein
MLGEKRKVRDEELLRHGNDFMKICRLHENMKRAKQEVVAATANYEEACSAVAKMKARMLEMFNDLE